MRRRSWVTTLACGGLLTVVVGMSAAPGGAAAGRRPAAAQQQPAELDAMLRAMRPARIERSIRRLASFGTRHTLSSQDDPARGIGAARDWIHEQFQRYAERPAGG